MVLPNHIEQAEKWGMPEDDTHYRTCPSCLEEVPAEDIIDCDFCGEECCPLCRVESVGLQFCSPECAISKLEGRLKEAEQAI